MKLLHTSDWHVGKAIRGHSRAQEHIEVLTEITEIADAHEVDLVIVAGDLFDSAAPSADSERIVYQALLNLAGGGRRVAVISGNHDNPARLAAVAPLLELGEISVLSRPAKPEGGGVISFTTRDGTPVRLAQLPFVSKRQVVRAADLMSLKAYEAAQSYTDRVSGILGALCSDFDGSAVNLLSLHGFVQGGEAGGGERPAHLIEDYHVASQAVPAGTTYAALGHLHRPQLIPGRAPIHYCGSPLQMDFGERDQQKVVKVVEAVPGSPANVTEVALTKGRQLIQLKGTVAEVLEAAAEGPPDAWLKAILTGGAGVGVADEMRESLGERLVDIRVTREASGSTPHEPRLSGHTPQELFEMYLREEDRLVGGAADPALMELFNDLLEDATAAEVHR